MYDIYIIYNMYNMYTLDELAGVKNNFNVGP